MRVDMRGRPKGSRAAPKEATRGQELERRVRKLGAENAYLKKLAAPEVGRRPEAARRRRSRPCTRPASAAARAPRPIAAGAAPTRASRARPSRACWGETSRRTARGRSREPTSPSPGSPGAGPASRPPAASGGKEATAWSVSRHPDVARQTGVLDTLTPEIPEGARPTMQPDMGRRCRHDGCCGRLEAAGAVQGMPRRGAAPATARPGRCSAMSRTSPPAAGSPRPRHVRERA